MTLNQLRHFQVLAQYQHYNKASKALFISQPSLSASINNLEEELGVPLFEHHGRNVILTKYGQMYSEQINAVLQQLEKANREVRNYRNMNVDVASIHRLRTKFLPELARDFSRGNWRDATFSFHEGITKTVLEGLKSGIYDVGFCSFQGSESELVFTLLTTDKLVVIVPNDHELADRESISVRELEKYPMVSYAPQGKLGADIAKKLADLNVRPVTTCYAADEAVIYSLVRAHFGVGITVDLPEHAGKDIKTLPIEENFTHSIFMVHPKSVSAPAARGFIEFVKKRYSLP